MPSILGQKIKRLRVAQNKKLKDVSELTGFSISYLSKIERGDISISRTTLDAVSRVLGVSSEYFLETPEIIRNYEHTYHVLEKDFLLLERLGQGDNNFQMEAALLTVFPREKIADFPHLHGGEELIYILEGNLTAILDGESLELFPGDCLHFYATTAHSWHNKTSKIVKLLAVNTPPHTWDKYPNNVMKDDEDAPAI